MSAVRDDLRPHIRTELLDLDRVIVVRDGPNTVAKLRDHARRTYRAFSLDGQPVFGISVFCALDAAGEASLNGLLAGRLSTFRKVHLPRASDLVGAGFDLIPTFRRPHFTLLIDGVFEAQLIHLRSVLGPPRDNPFGPRPIPSSNRR